MALFTACDDPAPKYLTNGPLYLKGLKQVRRGELKKAERSFLKDLSFKRSYASYLQLIFIYENQKKYPEVIVQCDNYLREAQPNDFNLKLVESVKLEAMESLHMQLNSQFGTTDRKGLNKNAKVEKFFRKKWYAARVRERKLEIKLQNIESKNGLEKLVTKTETVKKPKKKIRKQKIVSKQISKYLVVKGDSLSVIAIKVFGTSKRWREIQSANLPALDNPNKLRIGQTIKIPQPIQKKKKPVKNTKRPSKNIAEINKPKSVKKSKGMQPKNDSRNILTSEPLGSHENIMPRGRN